ncbi:MAG: hypothetical protein OEL53_17690 [Rhodospirillales bacterium]|nr:hypothetical protein [Rhodospirillales bacterium]
MIIGWLEHYGQAGSRGKTATRYLLDKRVTNNVKPGCNRLVKRDPPPELLRGIPRLFEAAIKACCFKRKYTSGYISFEKGDISVSDFNSRDEGVRITINKIMDDFENTAFVGIPRKFRPPSVWVAHTDKGRVELHFLTPRTILCGDERIRSINVHPPTKSSSQLWMAFQDMQNERYGMADPADPARSRAYKQAHFQTKREARKRKNGARSSEDYNAMLHDLFLKLIREGAIKCRNDIVTVLKAAGYRVPRVGKDYITIEFSPDRKRRFFGAIFSERFSSPTAIGLDGKSTRILDKYEIEKRYKHHLTKRAEFHNNRYGGPAWQEANPHADASQFCDPRAYLKATMEPEAFKSLFGNCINPKIEVTSNGTDRVGGASATGRASHNEKFQNELREMKEQFDSLQARVEAREIRLSFRIESLTKQCNELSTRLEHSMKANTALIAQHQKIADELKNIPQN